MPIPYELEPRLKITQVDDIIQGNRINFKCLNSDCPKNCCGPCFENAEGMIKARPVFKVQKNTVPLLPKESEKVINKYGSQNVTLSDGLGYHILCTNENGCVFFDQGKNKCSIYTDNFKSCHSYPFFFDKYWGLCIDDTCPGVGAGWTDLSDIKNMVNSLVEVYENQFSETKKFLDKF